MEMLMMWAAIVAVGFGACLPSLIGMIVAGDNTNGVLLSFVSIYPISYGLSKIPEGIWLSRCLKCCGFMGCIEFYTFALAMIGVRNLYILAVLTILLSLVSVILWLRWYRKSEYYGDGQTGD